MSTKDYSSGELVPMSGMSETPSEDVTEIGEDSRRSTNTFYDSPELPEDENARRKLKRKILKNIFIISFVFFLNFTAYSGLSNLQSSLHIDQGMGTVTQSVLYGAMLVSCLFLPKIMISALGHKWTIPVSLAGYILWMAANGYAVWGTMVTASILLGISAAPLWTAQCSYFTKIAATYATINHETDAAALSRFFGIFFCCFQLAGLIGSVISSTVLKPSVSQSENTTLTPEEVEMYCGINDCPWKNVTNPNLDKPSSQTVWTLVGIYMGVACLGLILACTCLDNLPRYLQDDRSKVRQEAGQALLSTISQAKKKYQCLLIPITVFSGLEQGFFWAEWNKSYVSCSLGIWKVGLVTIPAFSVNAIVASISGHVTKYIGRIPIFTAGFCVHLAVMLVLLLWPLDSSKEHVFYILSSCWGFADGIWQTQLNAMYGALFKHNSEGAFCNYRMWESAGFIIVFAYSSFICTDVKLYVVMATLAVGMICYYAVEILVKYENHIPKEYKKNESSREV